jgi:hypothetical protein
MRTGALPDAARVQAERTRKELLDEHKSCMDKVDEVFASLREFMKTRFKNRKVLNFEKIPYGQAATAKGS